MIIDEDDQIMIDSFEFLKAIEQDFQFITGVPCSYFKDLLTYIVSNEKFSFKHVIATREDEAIGIAAGIGFSGKKTLVYMQNSGLGNIGDALTSLAQLYKIPMLLLVSYRGLESDRDFPEHSIMGKVNESILEAYNIPYWTLVEEKWQVTLRNAILIMNKTLQPVVILIQKGVLSQ